VVKITGPSGVVAFVDESVASGLVAAGHAEYVKDAPAKKTK
jgi:hypothetical protein